MPVDALPERAAYIASIYQCRHIGITVVELNQYRFVNIVVNHNNPFVGTPDKATNKFVRIKYLSVEEYAFFGRQGSADEKIDFVGQNVKSLVVFQ